jgi:hypothetical protein
LGYQKEAPYTATSKTLSQIMQGGQNVKPPGIADPYLSKEGGVLTFFQMFFPT